MIYYDHATAIAFKLERWSDARTPRNFELEAIACEQGMVSKIGKIQSLYRRSVSVIRGREILDKRVRHFLK